MLEKQYVILRKLSFWLLFFLFFIFAPTLVYYSLGYKFDWQNKKFIKTGIIYIKSRPSGATIFLNKKILRETTPCAIRNILPGKYNLLIKKEDFYTYQIEIEVEPNLVREIEAILLPLEKNIKKIPFSFSVYRLFPFKHFFTTKFFVFADSGLYLIDKNFKEYQTISRDSLDKDIAFTLKGLLFKNNFFIFWNQGNIWIVKQVTEGKQEAKIHNIYKAEECIKKVFWGPERGYLLIQDGLKVIALNIEALSVKIELLKLRSLNAEIYVLSPQDIIYIKDKLPNQEKFSLFKVELKTLLNNNERNK
jgi:hypothetical protein